MIKSQFHCPNKAHLDISRVKIIKCKKTIMDFFTKSVDMPKWARPNQEVKEIELPNAKMALGSR